MNFNKKIFALLCALLACGISHAQSGQSVSVVRAQSASQQANSNTAQPSTQGLPADYVLMVDCSGSMRDQLDQIINLAKSVVARNRPDDQTMILRFVNRAQVVEDFTADRGNLEDALDSLYVEGGQTAIYDALALATQHLSQFNQGVMGRKKAIVLITDGEDRASQHTQDEVISALRQANVRVFVIGVQGDLRSPQKNADSFIKRLALETGGHAYLRKKGADLSAAIEETARLIHQ